MKTRRVCVRGLVVRDGKLLAQRLKNKDGSAMDFWSTPGGGVDPMESLYNALKREMIEETGVEPNIGKLILVQQFAMPEEANGKDKERLEFFFEITNADDYTTIDIASTSHGEAEIAEYDFVDLSNKNLLPTILQSQEFLAALQDPAAKVLFYTVL